MQARTAAATPVTAATAAPVGACLLCVLLSCCLLSTRATHASRRATCDAACNATAPEQVQHYNYIDGMQPLLARLNAAGFTLHAMSNYPVWYRLIEDKLQLSRYLHWTFLSCSGPMKVRWAVPGWLSRRVPVGRQA